MPSTKFVLLMRGIPGAGKSTAAKTIASLIPGSVVLSADDHMFRDGAKFSLERLSLCHRACLADLRSVLLAGAPLVVIDNTHLRREVALPYVEEARRHGVPHAFLELVADPEVAFSRNVHGIPRAVFDILTQRAEKRLPGEWSLLSLPAWRDGGGSVPEGVEAGMSEKRRSGGVSATDYVLHVPKNFTNRDGKTRCGRGLRRQLVDDGGRLRKAGEEETCRVCLASVRKDKRA